MPMTMAEQNPVSYLLDGMVHCRRCNTPMTTATGGLFGVEPQYVCPSRSEACDTPDIPSEPFNRLVVETVIRAALEGENTRRVAETVQEDAQQQIRKYTFAKYEVALFSNDVPSFGALGGIPPSDPPQLDPDMERLLHLEPGEYIEPLRSLESGPESPGWGEGFRQ